MLPAWRLQNAIDASSRHAQLSFREKAHLIYGYRRSLNFLYAKHCHYFMERIKHTFNYYEKVIPEKIYRRIFSVKN